MKTYSTTIIKFLSNIERNARAPARAWASIRDARACTGSTPDAPLVLARASCMHAGVGSFVLASLGMTFIGAIGAISEFGKEE